jgi:hypothetical protein
VASQSNNSILVWPQGSTTPTKTISGNLNSPHSVFVTINGDVYVDNGYANRRIDKWPYNSTNSVMVMNISATCYSLFVSMNNTLYCSIEYIHTIIKFSLEGGANKPITVAGIGSPAYSSTALSSPRGIFVDINLDLYVADCGNDRIQCFDSGQSIGTAVAGAGATGTITLSCPTGVTLDAQGYLFIVDSSNHRIIGSGLNGFRCLVGCSGRNGSGSNQLYNPQSMAFDSVGNMFVTDRNNHRIQKFTFMPSSCSELFFLLTQM